MERCDDPVQVDDLKATPGGKRTVGTEAYFTTDELAKRCVEFVNAILPLDQFSYILEPSAGAGAFVRALPSGKVVAIDLEPRAEGIECCDFFRFEPPFFQPNVLVIGNPPFGQRGSLAIRFLDRAMEFASVVAFILPRSFRKHTFLNRIDPQFHLLGEFDCADFVLPTGEPVAVNCVFQVWQKQATLRALVELPTEHEDFEMKHFHLSRTSREEFERAEREYDFAIAQVGANFAPKKIQGLTAGSYWFIKAKGEAVPRVFERLDFDFLDGLNPAHKSLSKKDIIAAYLTACPGQRAVT